MDNYFKGNGHTPIMINSPRGAGHINVEPLFTAMFELSEPETQNTPRALADVVEDSIRYLDTNVPAMEKEHLPHYHQMMDRLYDLKDMFDAMFTTK